MNRLRPPRPLPRPPARLRLWRRAAEDGGKAAIEFAFVAPIFLGMIGAIMEFSGIMFIQALLEGSAREASRYGITGFTTPGVSREDQIMAIIEQNTLGLIDLDQLQMTTLVYENFGDVGQPEPFTDANDNDVYDAGEAFNDVNGNGAWDPDMGAAGLGGPGDVVVYQMSYDWDIIIPMFVPFFGESIRLNANIAVRNEPFE
ncbi:MAG TPA: TadE/TadG family type IV pilus assembly protein [Kofleriaceae bacterium]|nr:TadE/TadG family type IV pilus assembly protein [Kofleriaceae bacterium]